MNADCQAAVPDSWNETSVAFPHDLLLNELVQQQVGLSPEAVALRFEGVDLSYRELDRRANRLANRLSALGVGPDVLVAVVAERSLEMVVALLAVLKAGGAYVPMDPSYPQARLAFMLEDSNAPVLLTQRNLRKALPKTASTVVELDSQADWNTESDAPPPVTATADDLAYVIYTSGSTGRPKGAMNTHRAIVNRLLWMQHRYELSASDSVLQKTPFSFDVSGWEFFWPLLTGARLVIARPEGHKDPAYLARLIDEENVTVCHFVPSMLQAFLGEPDLGLRCSSLRHVICSGEALTRPLQDRFFAAIDAELHNLYGPTEAAIDVTHWTCRRDWDEPVVPIGRPVANTQIHIVGERATRVGVGETGELWICGVQVARGYLNREELTRERFVADPFSDVPGARAYRTGDLARWRPDGSIEFLGRIDHQVKILGVRIELGEVEAALESHPMVEQAAVVAHEKVPGEPRLVAYVASAGGERLVLEELRPYLLDQLPDALVPAVLVSLDEMPLTENGKVDRKALPEPTRDRPALEQAYVEPRTPLERTLETIWSELLQIDDIGARDRFFDLGGNSLLAARFIRQLEEKLGENIYIVSIFDTPTISEYANFLERDYPDAVARCFTGSSERAPKRDLTPVLDEASVESMRTCIPVLPSERPREPDASPNPPAVFVLAPPRSGTTLLRVMLAGHPQLFAAAELQLLGFHTLAERSAAFQGKFRLWREGTQRCVMELRDCDAGEAGRMMDAYEERGFTTKQFYAVLQEWIGDRTLVDKSPSYVLDPAALEKAERDFRDPLYIHLTRHPLAMVQSFERYHMEQVLFVEPHDFSSRQLAELVWLISHQNTQQFLKGVPAERQVRIRYEDLVTDPEVSLQSCCAGLGLPFHSDLVDPYKDIEKKMVDGVHSVSAPMGDTRLLEHGKIDPSLADAWKAGRHDPLSEATWAIAGQFGYERLDAPGGPKDPDPSRSSGRRRVDPGRARQARARHRGQRDSKGDSG
ncbi:MAG: amino acid adenylation domain-containing protein [bacterium]|nr:amino acid adenylation domain-containing protein [bacterium]